MTGSSVTAEISSVVIFNVEPRSSCIEKWCLDILKCCYFSPPGFKRCSRIEPVLSPVDLLYNYTSAFWCFIEHVTADWQSLTVESHLSLKLIDAKLTWKIVLMFKYLSSWTEFKLAVLSFFFYQHCFSFLVILIIML